jgi:predicted RNA-binding Zn-ribbon protein involved in translation (DUF1610 family)
MSMQSSYGVAWRDLRARKIIFWAILLGYVPGVLAIFLIVGLPLSALTGVKPDYFFYTIASCWMAAFVVASVRVALFSCPRCGKSFFAKWWYRNPFAKKCVHCGLPKWANLEMPGSN